MAVERAATPPAERNAEQERCISATPGSHLAVLIQHGLQASPHGIIKDWLTPYGDAVVVTDHFTAPAHLPGQRRVAQYTNDDLRAPALPAAWRLDTALLQIPGERAGRLAMDNPLSHPGHHGRRI